MSYISLKKKKRGLTHTLINTINSINLLKHFFLQLKLYV